MLGRHRGLVCLLERDSFDSLAREYSALYEEHFGTDAGIETLTLCGSLDDIAWLFHDPETNELLLELRWTPVERHPILPV